VLPPDVSDSVEKQLIICPSELRLGLKLPAARAILDGREYAVDLDRNASSRWDRDRNRYGRVTTADHAASVAGISHQVNIAVDTIVAGHLEPQR
jgi:hypothetical protein